MSAESRKQILGRIRGALQQSATRPPLPGAGRVFSPMPAHEWIPRLKRELLALKVEIYQAGDLADARQWVKEFARRHDLRRIMVSSPDAVAVSTSLPQMMLPDGAKGCRHPVAEVDLSITGCDALVARTGSVVLTSCSASGRVLSVLPPVHLVVARVSQVVPDLMEAYQMLEERYRGRWPSMMTFITGPSRTADIEKVLVLGAHGPRKLGVLLLSDEV